MPYTIPSYTVSPGSVYQPRQRPILNRISGAIAAWSTRRLISSAPADIARGRDASTNEQDFTAAELAGTGFTDLAGAGDGFYVTLYDQIGSNNATQSTAAGQPKGVDTGALITDGVGVPVLSCDGIDDNLIVTDNAAFDFSTEFTLHAAIKNDSANIASAQMIAAKFDSGTNQREWALYFTSEEKLAIAFGDSTLGTLKGVYSTNSALQANEWNYVAMVFNAGDVTLYKAGVLVSGSILTGSIPTEIFNGSANITIGASLNNGAGSLFWDGQINDVIVFNRALSSGEISRLYTALI